MCGEKAVTDWFNMSKVVVEVSCWRFLAELCSMIGYNSWSWQWSNQDINWEQSMLYHAEDNWHTQNIQSTETNLYYLGYVNCFDVWVPYKVEEKNLLDHISTCNSLLKCNENIWLLKQVVTGDEKWILYNNVECLRSWSKWNEPLPTTPNFIIPSSPNF